MEQDRYSNIELLQIIAMLYIIIYHFIHAVTPSTENPEFPAVFIPMLHIGVICFVLISGYWGIKPSLKGFLKFYLQCSFYSLFIYFVYSLINPSAFNIKELIVAFFPIQWWFVKVYMCLYLLSPIINIPLKTEFANKKILWIVVLAIISFIPISLGLDNDGKNVINFILIYYIGNFLRHHVKIDDIKRWRNKLILIYITYNISIIASILITANYPKVQNLIWWLFFPYNSVGLIINAVIFFLIFAAIQYNIKSKAINWLAVSVLPVYLLHENKYLGGIIWDYIANLQSNIESPIFFSFILVLLAITTLFTCLLLDKLLAPLYNKIHILLFKSSLLQRADVKINAILSQD